MTIRERTWEILDVAKPGDKASRAFDILILSLIMVNVAAVIIGTVESVQARWGTTLFVFEVFSVVIFTIEYAGRIWSCVSDNRYAGGFRGRMRFVRQPLPLVDLFAVLPFYLPFLGIDLRFIRAFRLFRIIRLAKASRYYSSLSLIRDTVKARKEELVLTFVVLALLLIVAASGIYYCENDAQPEQFPSIPGAFWWAVVTLTTVGYGDAYPITVAGKFFASLVAILGIGMFALPTGILGAGFVEEIRRRRAGQEEQRCPHCGREIA
jgi:voltage-gated potassium channel